MNKQYFGEHTTKSDSDNESDEEQNTPVENQDLSTDEAPTLADLVEETPAGSGTVPDGTKMGETIVHEAPPMGERIPYNAPKDEPVVYEAPVLPKAVSAVALLDPGESELLRKRWSEIQGAFVDEPRSAVQQADALVSEVVEKITRMFADEHSSLEGQWKKGDDVSTEDLRKALQHYRSFFNRLVV